MVEYSLGNVARHDARYTHVDLLRGLAAVSILFVHYRMFYVDGNVPGSQTFDLTRAPFYWLFYPLYTHGHLAVQLFWMLSGFVFCVAYRGQEKIISPLKFFVWRFSRLYPLHFATLIIMAILQIISFNMFGRPLIIANNDVPHFVLQLFIASNWWDAKDYSFNAPIWSVSIEVLIYGVFYAYMRFGRTGFMPTLLVAVVFGAAVIFIKNAIFTCGLLFFGGILIFQVVDFTRRFTATAALMLAAAGVAGSCCLTIILALSGRPLFETVIMYGCLPAVLFATAILDTRLKPVPKVLHWVGDITYSTYLLHFPVILTILIVCNANGIAYDSPDSPAFLIAYIATVVGLGTLTYRYFEMPMQERIRAFYRRRARALPIAESAPEAC
jgi:peptidoglycan/LPS O-acetylase OafA/YrhL